MIVRSPRLEIVNGNLEHAKAELSNREKLSELLNAEIPSNWPPPLNDEASMNFFLKYIEENPDSTEFIMWYIILEEDKKRKAIGNIGFKGKPDETGTIEIGYSIIEEYQQMGFASEAVSAMVDWAFTRPKVERVIAETLENGFPSQKVLRNNSFNYIGQGSEPGVIRFEHTKENHTKFL